MKLVSGHAYLRGSNGEVVPYSEALAKASGYEKFIQDGDFENDLQLPENQKVVARKAIPRAVSQDVQQVEVKKPVLRQPQAPKVIQPISQVAPTPVAVKSAFGEHMDIRTEMESDLGGLE